MIVPTAVTVVDYFVTELWDVTLSSLKCQANPFTSTTSSSTDSATSTSASAGVNNRGSVNVKTTNIAATAATILFPIKETKLFVQNTPFLGTLWFMLAC